MNATSWKTGWLDDNGHPLPIVTGYPFIVTPFGIYDLDQAICGIAASYRDVSVVELCENSQLFIREWTFFDQCEPDGMLDVDGTALDGFRQRIVVGDFTAPVITDPGDKIIISTNSLSCDGTLVIPELEYTDNCSENLMVTAEVFRKIPVPILDDMGNQIGTDYELEPLPGTYEPGEIVGTNLDLGELYTIHYTVKDGCGNQAEAEVDVEVIDNLEPIAVCDDDLHISIGDGVARISAEDVDEGSWDNCGLEDIFISRKLKDNDLRDAYLMEVYNLSFDQLKPDETKSDWDKNVDSDIWVLESNEDMQVLRFKDGMWFTWWSKEVWFLCEDINTEVRVELLVIDVNGNTNTCHTDIPIEDKLPPTCHAPDHVTLVCTDLPYGFDPYDDDQLSDLFGDASASDNCGGAVATLIRKKVDWHCNAGMIQRWFQAVDAQGRTSVNDCYQKITVESVNDYVIKFPADLSTDCLSNTMFDTIVELSEGACDDLVVSIYDERFDASGDACYKIKRTFKVINWCQYDGEGGPMHIGRDEDGNGITGDKDVYVIFTEETRDVTGKGESFTYIDANDDPFKAPPSNADKHYRRIDFREGFYEYSQFIKVHDNTAPEISYVVEGPFCSITADCFADVSIPLRLSDGCAVPEDINVQVFLLPDATTGLPNRIDLQNPANAVLVNFQFTGSFPNYFLKGRFPLGEHKLEVWAEDGCQNSSRQLIPFEVVDCKPPALICINGLAVDLMPLEAGIDADGDGDVDAGAVSIWASDFKVSGTSDCSGPIKLSINRVGEAPSVEKTELVLTCDDVDTVMVEVYAWDSALNPIRVQPDGRMGGPNYDYCETYIILQDNMFNLCGPSGPAAVSGLISTEEDEPVENVSMQLSGGTLQELITDQHGNYSFAGLADGGDYTVSPQRNDHHQNGISTFDLVLINKHILHTQPLDSPYKLIAADVNRSGTITALDLIHVRKLVLSIYKEFPKNTSWRFIPADYEFPDPGNPWAEEFPEVLSYNNLIGQMPDADFMAIKIGDVNGTVQANQQSAEHRSLSGTFQFQLKEQELRTGQEYRIPFTAEQLNNIQGYQFTLNYEGLELVDIEYGLAKEENFGFLEKGILTTSWHLPSRQTVDQAKDEPLFTLVVRSQKDAKLSDLLRINSRYTQAEAYSATNELLDVALTFEDGNGRHLEDSFHLRPDAFHLEQNQPNPWSDKTSIGFQMPQAGEVMLGLYDAQGRQLRLIRNYYEAGAHQVEISREDLPAVGIIYYTLSTQGFTATRKMILLKK